MATAAKTIRWGMIGCGDVAEVKSGPGFQKAEGSALVAVMRRRGDLAADYARRHGVPRWYDDAGALIADPEVDAVYIATPPLSATYRRVKQGRCRAAAAASRAAARQTAPTANDRDTGVRPRSPLAA